MESCPLNFWNIYLLLYKKNIEFKTWSWLLEMTVSEQMAKYSLKLGDHQQVGVKWS